MDNVIAAIRKKLKIEKSCLTCDVGSTSSSFLDFPQDKLKALDKILLNPVTYFISHTAKQSLQHMLTDTFNYWIKAPQNITNLIQELGQIGESIILLLDDMQDETLTRRGYPCAHLIYGIPQTINACYYLQAVSGQTLLHTKQFQEWTGCKDHSSLSRILFGLEVSSNESDKGSLGMSTFKRTMLIKKIRMYRSALTESLRGQATEMYWRINVVCPTIEEYKVMVLRKTGSALAMVVEILNLHGANFTEDVDYLPLLYYLVLFAQIKDDYQNIFNEEYQKSKGYCEDITEGKFGFPTIYVVNNFPEKGDVLKNILEQRTRDVELLNYYKSILQECGADIYTRTALQEIKEKVMEEYNKLGAHNHHFDKHMTNDLLVIDNALIV